MDPNLVSKDLSKMESLPPRNRDLLEPLESSETRETLVISSMKLTILPIFSKTGRDKMPREPEMDLLNGPSLPTPLSTDLPLNKTLLLLDLNSTMELFCRIRTLTAMME